jgi:ribosomal protein L32
MPELEDLGSDTGYSEPESESDAGNLRGLGDRWEYRRIVARRFDSTGRREALLEWEPTWVPEDEVGGLKRALRRYAKERRERQSPAAKACSNCGAKKRKYHA